MDAALDFSALKALLEVGGLGVNGVLVWALWRLDRRILRLEVALTGKV